MRQDTRVLRPLLLRVLYYTFFAVAVLVGVNALAAWLSRFFHPGSLLASVTDSSFSTPVVAAVGALAVFLALFFTTVGVIASTAYANVPGEIRQLFVRERTSTFYVGVVVTSLVWGTALLTFPVVSGLQVRGLTIVFFWVLTVVAIVSLAVLGKNLFNFFDPSTLALRLYSQFVRALRRASGARRDIPDEVEQQLAHRQAASALARYRQIVTLLSARDYQDAGAPNSVIHQLLWCWETNSRLKSSIPTLSGWYSRTPVHANWLTADYQRISTAMQTHTSIQPTESPEPLWVEREIVEQLRSLLPVLAQTSDGTLVVGVLDVINQRVFDSALRMQFDGAFTLLKVVTDYRERSSQLHDSSESDSANLLRLAIAEREILAFTSLWLGLARPLEHLDAQQLAQSLDKAVRDARAPYRAGAPRRLLSLLEDVSTGIGIEKRTEGRRITPDWWLNHLGARHIATLTCEAVNQLVERTENTLISPLIADLSLDAQLVAVRVFELLELIHKMQYHMQVVRVAYERLETLRHEPSDDELWPALPAPEDHLLELEEQLMQRLAGIAPALATSAHDPSMPDLFGQAYRHLFDAAFRAVIEARTDLATVFFPMIIDVAERARQRLGSDLSDQRQRERSIFGTEPFVDMMELSGYALLMARVDPPGIATLVNQVWDLIFTSTSSPDLMGLLLGVLELQHSTYALTPGSMARSERQRALARVLRDRGIVRQDAMWGVPRPVPHEDPIVAVFAPDDMVGLFHNLEDLFVVEYLMAHPEFAGHSVPRQVELLEEAIDFERNRRPGPDEGPPE